MQWTLEQVASGDTAVAVNTLRTNRLAEEALRAGVVTFPGLEPPWTLRREVHAGTRSRLDLLLEDRRGRFWVEVKSVTWTERRVARFPDAVTSRGARHLEELVALLGRGDRAALLYVVQRGDAAAVTAAAEVDPAYAAAFRRALEAGVVCRGVVVAVTPQALTPHHEIPVGLE